MVGFSIHLHEVIDYLHCYLEAGVLLLMDLEFCSFLKRDKKRRSTSQAVSI